MALIDDLLQGINFPDGILGQLDPSVLQMLGLDPGSLGGPNFSEGPEEGLLDVSNDQVEPPKSNLEPSGLSVLDDLGIPTLPGFEDTPREDLRVFRTVGPDGQTISFMAPVGFDMSSLDLGAPDFTAEGKDPQLAVPGGTLLTDTDPQLSGFNLPGTIDPDDRLVDFLDQLPKDDAGSKSGFSGRPNFVSDPGRFQGAAQNLVGPAVTSFDPNKNPGRRVSFSSSNSPGATLANIGSSAQQQAVIDANAGGPSGGDDGTAAFFQRLFSNGGIDPQIIQQLFGGLL